MNPHKETMMEKARMSMKWWIKQKAKSNTKKREIFPRLDHNPEEVNNNGSGLNDHEIIAKLS
jgi:hypothetical protein